MANLEVFGFWGSRFRAFEYETAIQSAFVCLSVGFLFLDSNFFFGRMINFQLSIDEQKTSYYGAGNTPFICIMTVSPK